MIDRATLASLDQVDHDTYVVAPLPNDTDAQLRTLVESFATSDESVRHAACLSLSVRQSRVLAAFGMRMAALAVRTEDDQQLRLAFDAAAFSSTAEKEDPRDASIEHFALRDAAVRLGLDPRREFRRAADLALPGTAKILRGFPYPVHWLNYLERIAMRFGWRPIKAHETPEGFRYDPNSSVSKEQMAALVEEIGNLKSKQ